MNMMQNDAHQVLQGNRCVSVHTKGPHGSMEKRGGTKANQNQVLTQRIDFEK